MSNQKTQILYVHGGMTFENKNEYLNYLQNREITITQHQKWQEDYLSNQLKDICTVIKPKMPLKEWANYSDWKIHFKRYLEILDDKIILIGLSLGGLFLVKYLAENILPKKIISLYIIGAPFNGSDRKNINGSFNLPTDLSKIETNCKNIKLLFSEDDNVIPIEHSEKYREKLPSATILKYSDKNGHFRIKKFPEIIEMITQDLKTIK